MSFNSNCFSVTATTTETNVILPTFTASVLFVASSTNTDYIKVRVGGGAPLILRAGQSIALSIETILQTMQMTGLPLNPVIFITVMSHQSNSGSQGLDVYTTEWRTG